MLFLGASGGLIKASTSSETIEEVEPASSSSTPALAQGHWAIQPEKLAFSQPDRTPLPSIQMSAMVAVIAGSAEEKVSAH